MDPNANLREQLELTERMLDPDSNYVDSGDALRLAELVEALSEWLRRGGALPDRWRREPVQLAPLISPCVDCGAEGGQPCDPACKQESYQ